MKFCTVDQCQKIMHSNKMCQMHYLRWKKHGDPEFIYQHVKKKCSDKNCEEISSRKGLCNKHYKRMQKFGKTELDRKTAFDRFVQFAEMKETDECINWKGSRTTSGYGQISINNKPNRTHRVAFEMFIKEIPANMWVLHKCDNRLCVNPKHLYLGDRKQNQKDMDDRNRRINPKGENNGKSKLTELEVIEIKKQLITSNRIRELAKKYGVSRDAISDIKSNKTWSHIKLEQQA